MEEPISFRVVKEPYGWAVRRGHGMMTPFRSRTLAVEHARRIAEALRGSGARAEVVFEEPSACDQRPFPPRGRSRFPSLWS